MELFAIRYSLEATMTKMQSAVKSRASRFRFVRLCGAAVAFLAFGACEGEAQRPADIPFSAPTPAPRVEIVARGLDHPWGLAFLPSGDMLVTERNGGVKLVRSNGAVERVTGGPTNVLQDGQSGLLDVALDPRFSGNQFVYVTFVEGNDRANHTALYRARFDGRALLGGRVIFRARPDKAGATH